MSLQGVFRKSHYTVGGSPAPGGELATLTDLYMNRSHLSQNPMLLVGACFLLLFLFLFTGKVNPGVCVQRTI